MADNNQKQNILFIMCDQLRHDYLGCAGHPTIKTPNIDKLAARGVRFMNAYAQAPLCGPSRASFYTGRYVTSHGVSWNEFPLRIDEMTMGDYLEPLGMRAALVGKTHSHLDRAGLERLGLDENAPQVVRIKSAGFEPFERDDGLHPDPIVSPDLAYNRYLSAQGYEGANPWDTHANSGLGPDGSVQSGWYLRNSNLPARVRDEHSETAYMTDRAMDFMKGVGAQPWCLHLSYIKPHWPYIVSEPFASMYGPDDVIPVNAAEEEKNWSHPVYQALKDVRFSKAFQTEEARRTVIPAYMGLISQIDHHLGRLFDWMDGQGLLDNTVVVFTSDHGDYLGDHWLGEKDFCHDAALKIPLIIADPSEHASVTRGQSCTRMVEAIDLVPTFYDMAGGDEPHFRMEGQSLLPLLRGDDTGWKSHAFAELDISARPPVRANLGWAPKECRGYIIISEQWKMVIFDQAPPILFDLLNDPQELHDLGQSSDHTAIREALQAKLFQWLCQRHSRVMGEERELKEVSPTHDDDLGFLIGVW